MSSGSPPRKPRGGGGRFGGYGVPEKARSDEGLHFYLFIMRIIGSSLTIIQLRIMINRNIMMALLRSGGGRGSGGGRARNELARRQRGRADRGAPYKKKAAAKAAGGEGRAIPFYIDPFFYVICCI